MIVTERTPQLELFLDANSIRFTTSRVFLPISFEEPEDIRITLS